jgi:hypothetical protein
MPWKECHIMDERLRFGRADERQSARVSCALCDPGAGALGVGAATVGGRPRTDVPFTWGGAKGGPE